MVTIYDIAKKANCSAMTVSRVINNTGKVSDATRRRVLKIMEEMNYVPNTVARSLVLQQSKLLSLLITDITNPFYTALARGAEDAARQLGYRLLLANSDENLEKEKEYIDTVLAARVDGVLIAPAGDDSLDHLRKLRTHRIPFVMLDREVPGIESDTVLGDSKEGARQLCEHLIELGHRRIAFINGLPSVSTARLRLEGYKESLKLYNIPFDETIVYETGYIRPDTETKMEGIIDSVLHTVDRPSAILAASNFMALSAIRTLRNRGVQVPEDISVVCFDELEAGFVADPFMTVAAQPAYDFGYIGIQMLVERIGTDDVKEWRKIMLPSTLRKRGSAIMNADQRSP